MSKIFYKQIVDSKSKDNEKAVYIDLEDPIKHNDDNIVDDKKIYVDTVVENWKSVELLCFNKQIKIKTKQISSF